MICPACGQENPPRAKFCNECGTGLDPEETVGPTSVPLTSSGFVGRQQEMAQLLAALANARDGRGRVVMLVGEPGIGKTTTAEELTAIATAQDWQILWGRCHEGEGAPPYWPWLQPLREYVQRGTPDQIIAKMGLGAADIAEIVPELKTKLPDLEAPPALEAEQARFRLFDSITRFLKNVSVFQPLVLVLEDLHWADRSSLLLLEFLVRDIQSTPMLVIGTYRDVEVSRRHPLSETLGTIMRSQGFLRLHLTGLDEREVAQLIQKNTTGVTPPELSVAVHRRTEGNPLFVGEIIRMLPQEAKQAGADYLGAIPEGIRDALGRRLNRLSEDCNRALTVASVLGQEFTLEQLGPLLEWWTPKRLLEVIEEALAARVIEEMPGIVGRYQFAHALIQETLVAELTTTRRVQLHATIAESLEELYRDALELHAAELAFHFAEGQTLLGPNQLVRYSLMAGEQALAAYAWEEAQAYFVRGLAARNISLQGEESLPDAQAAELMFGLGRAQVGTAERVRIQDAVNTISRAFDYYVDSSEINRVISIAELFIPGGGIRTGVSRMIRQALSLASPGSNTEGRLLARYGFELGRVESDDLGAQDAFARALEIAEETGDGSLASGVLSSFAELDWYHLRFSDGLVKSLKAIDLAVMTEDVMNEARGRLNAVRALMCQGQGDRAIDHVSAFLALGEELSIRYLQLFAFLEDSRLAHLRGEFSKARSSSLGALRLDGQDSNPIFGLAMLEYETGNFAQGQMYLEQLLEIMRQDRTGLPGSTYIWPALAIPYAARVSGDLLSMQEALDASRFTLSVALAFPIYTAVARCGLGLQAIVNSDASAASEVYQEFSVVKATLVHPFLAGDRILGLLAYTMRDLAKAAGHFEDALVFCREAGYRPELAWTCCDYADSLLQRNEADDREKAMSLLDESLSITTELSMRPLQERVRSRIDTMGATRRSYPDGITQREAEVLTLIAQGKNNRQIGEALLITEATARRHVSNIYDKIGVANRAEATRYAINRGLV